MEITKTDAAKNRCKQLDQKKQIVEVFFFFSFVFVSLAQTSVSWVAVAVITGVDSADWEEKSTNKFEQSNEGVVLMKKWDMAFAPLKNNWTQNWNESNFHFSIVEFQMNRQNDKND